MTKKLKILLISVLFLVATVCVATFAGCKVKYTVEELREKYGLTAQITYFLNGTGGNFDDDSYIKHLYYKPGDMPMNIGKNSLISGRSALEVSDGFNFTGWYKVKVDSAGKPLYSNESDTYSYGDKYDVTKRMAMSDEEFDFSKPLQDGDHIYLCGDFYEDIKLRVNLLCLPTVDGSSFNKIEYTENGNTVTVEENQEIEYGTRLIPKTGNGLSSNANAIQNKFSGYTVEGFYEKVGDEYVPFTGWPVKYPEPDADGKYHDIVLYVKMLKGKWDIVSTPAEVDSMFALGSHNYYIKQDIDGEGREIRNIRNLTGTIWGGVDGHTLKNFKVVNNDITSTNTKASIFGQVQASAVIKNITLENFTVNFTVSSSGNNTVDPDISFVANTIDAAATIENVSVSGTMNVTLSTEKCEATNTTANRWLCGDKDDAAYDKIEVPNATCTFYDGEGNVVKDGSDNDRIYKVGNNNNNQTEDQ